MYRVERHLGVQDESNDVEQGSHHTGHQQERHHVGVGARHGGDRGKVRAQGSEEAQHRQHDRHHDEQVLQIAERGLEGLLDRGALQQLLDDQQEHGSKLEQG